MNPLVILLGAGLIILLVSQSKKAQATTTAKALPPGEPPTGSAPTPTPATQPVAVPTLPGFPEAPPQVSVPTTVFVPSAATPGAAPQPAAPSPAEHAADIARAIALAVQTKTPAALHAMADKLEAEGHHKTAAELREIARSIETLAVPAKPEPVPVSTKPRAPRAPKPAPQAPPVAAPAPAPAPVATAPIPVPMPFPVAVPPVALPPIMTAPAPVPVPAVDPRAARAADVARRISQTAGAYRESKDTIAAVKAFQLGEGLEPDGKYGRLTALAVARYGVIPPKPLYWPKQNTAQAMKDYNAQLTKFAQADPARVEEWMKAAA